VLSGYQGAEDVGAVILDAVAKVKATNGDAIYCCDPVMGDVGRGMFVRPGIPEFMRDRVVPAADVITPNHFELDFLAGTDASSTVAEVLAAVDVVRATGPRNVLVTSVVTEDAEDALSLIAVDESGAWRVTTPHLPITPNGGGDVTAAVYLAHLLGSGSTPTALGRTANTMFAILQRTLDSGRRELELVGSQEDIARPPTRFEVTQLR
jgi:pyridoxine kinase